MAERPVTLGFVGCGQMGQMAHIFNYAEIPGIRLKAVTDVKHRQAELVAARYGIEQVYDSMEEICNDPEIGGVACIMFWALQVEPVIKLLEAGKHVIVEKPLAGSAAAAERMVDAAKASGKHLVCGYMKCHDSGVAWARERIVARGDKVNQVRMFFSGGDWWTSFGKPISTNEPAPKASDDWYPEGMNEHQRKALGLCINLYSHHVSLFRRLLGKELELQTIIRHGDSVVTTFVAGGTHVLLVTAPMACDWWEERTNVVFDDGYMEILTPPPMARNSPAKVVDYVKGKDGATSAFTAPVTGWNWAFKRQAEQFVEVCAGRAEPLVPGEYGYRDMVLLEKMARMYPE